MNKLSATGSAIHKENFRHFLAFSEKEIEFLNAEMRRSKNILLPLSIKKLRNFWSFIFEIFDQFIHQFIRTLVHLQALVLMPCKPEPHLRLHLLRLQV